MSAEGAILVSFIKNCVDKSLHIVPRDVCSSRVAEMII